MNTDTISGARWGLRRPAAIRRGVFSAGALAILTLALAACAGTSAPGVASLKSSTATSSASSAGGKGGSALAFAQCMRQHGVTNFPDPGSGGNLKITGGNGLDPNSPTFQAAQTACQSLLPNGGQPDPSQQAAFQQAALQFSQCMRAHGIANFPDPQFSSGSGGGGVRLQLPSGIDPNSPQFKNAQQACQSLLPRPSGGQGTTGGPQGGGNGPVQGRSGS